MARLVIWVALASLLATATAAEATDFRPTLVDECYDYLSEPLDSRQRMDCRFAVSDLPDDANREVLEVYEDISDVLHHNLLP